MSHAHLWTLQEVGHSVSHTPAASCKPSYKLEKRAATVTGETHLEEMSPENLPMLTDAALLSGS